MQKAIKEGQVDGGEMDGYSAAERFFISYAQVWAGNVRDEEIVRLTKEDPHSPCECNSYILFGRFRICRIVRHLNVLKFLVLRGYRRVFGKLAH